MARPGRWLDDMGGGEMMPFRCPRPRAVRACAARCVCLPGLFIDPCCSCAYRARPRCCETAPRAKPVAVSEKMKCKKPLPLKASFAATKSCAELAAVASRVWRAIASTAPQLSACSAERLLRLAIRAGACISDQIARQLHGCCVLRNVSTDVSTERTTACSPSALQTAQPLPPSGFSI